LSNEQLVQKGKASLEEHKIDMVIANLVDKPGQGFASKTNDVFIVKRDGSVRHLSLETKRFISKIIFDELLNLST